VNEFRKKSAAVVREESKLEATFYKEID